MVAPHLQHDVLCRLASGSPQTLHKLQQCALGAVAATLTCPLFIVNTGCRAVHKHIGGDQLLAARKKGGVEGQQRLRLAARGRMGRVGRVGLVGEWIRWERPDPVDHDPVQPSQAICPVQPSQAPCPAKPPQGPCPAQPPQRPCPAKPPQRPCKATPIRAELPHTHLQQRRELRAPTRAAGLHVPAICPAAAAVEAEGVVEGHKRGGVERRRAEAVGVRPANVTVAVAGRHRRHRPPRAGPVQPVALHAKAAAAHPQAHHTHRVLGQRAGLVAAGQGQKESEGGGGQH
eukprot:365530-Chlamydomonas_euryale.AAC.2